MTRRKCSWTNLFSPQKCSWMFLNLRFNFLYEPWLQLTYEPCTSFCYNSAFNKTNYIYIYIYKYHLELCCLAEQFANLSSWGGGHNQQIEQPRLHATCGRLSAKHNIVRLINCNWDIVFVIASLVRPGYIFVYQTWLLCNCWNHAVHCQVQNTLVLLFTWCRWIQDNSEVGWCYLQHACVTVSHAHDLCIHAVCVLSRGNMSLLPTGCALAFSSMITCSSVMNKCFFLAKSTIIIILLTISDQLFILTVSKIFLSL